MDRLLSLEEMAAELNRTPRQFRKDITSRKIPHIHIGRQRLFDRAIVLEHLTTPTVRAKSKSRTVVQTEGRFASRLGL